MFTFVQIHNYAASDEEAIKAKLRRLEDMALHYEREMKNAKAREKRRQLSFDGLTNDLKAMNLMNARLEEKLEAFKGLYFLYKSYIMM